MKKFLIGFLSLFFILTGMFIVFGDEPFTCQYRYSESSQCEAGESHIFSISYIMSSHIRSPELAQSPHYPYHLCCSSQTDIDFKFIESGNACGTNYREVLYFTGETNARAAKIFNPNHHHYKLCAKIRLDAMHSLNIHVGYSLPYDEADYKCLGLLTDEVNSHMATCEATSIEDPNYAQGIWSRIMTAGSISCTNSCMDSISGRVYLACQDIPGCENIPESCDGALYNTWVQDGDSGNEVLCSKPWSLRPTTYTAQFEVDSDCSNMIVRKYTTLLNNEVVTLNVYVCSE